ncbi:MAG: hypothetical protein IJH75_02370 [Mogibacterium sp.]|nr:hypothetical protein [Mogibacterium sp.]
MENSEGKKEKRLGIIGIIAMYLGMILGAGFSSGRECWQYFGVFGKLGYFGAVFNLLLFLAIGYMLTYIALSKQTADLGELISPVDNKLLINGIGTIIGLIYYTLIMSMSAAGSSLLQQQFGIPKPVGGVIIVILVIATVLGDFERLSKVFSKIMPVVFIISIFTIVITLLSSSFTQSGPVTGYEPSPMAPTWWFAGIIFASYNIIGMIAMSGNCALRAKDRKTAFLGAGLGTFLLGLMTILLLTALLKDMAYSASLDLPMLGYANRLSKPLAICYAVVLYGSIYSTASSTFYGFSTRIPGIPAKKYILIAAAVIGFALGLLGFQTLVAYLYPPQGYFGILVMILITVNYLKERRKNRNNR